MEHYESPTANDSPAIIYPREPHATLIQVTPQQAADWLKNRRRSKNRKLNMVNVRQYVKDMKSNRWIINNDAIAFDTQGFLLNGHHRLRACVDADVPFYSFVHWNLPDGSFITMDVNAKRSMADTLDLNGVMFARLIGPALNWWWRFHNNRLIGPNDATYQEQKELYESDKSAIDDAARFINDLKLSPIVPPPIALFCLLIFRVQDKSKADEFLKSLSTGANLEETNPVLLYRNILVKPRRKGETLKTAEVLAYAFKAWNLILQDRSVKKLSLSKNETDQLLKGAPLMYGSNVSAVS